MPFFSSHLTGYSLFKSLNPQERKSMGLHLHLTLHGMGMRIGTSYRLPPGSALPAQFFPESYSKPSTTSPPPPPPVRPHRTDTLIPSSYFSLFRPHHETLIQYTLATIPNITHSIVSSSTHLHHHRHHHRRSGRVFRQADCLIVLNIPS